jgi:hypothetical protein
MSYRGTEGKTTGYYVPAELTSEFEKGVAAWSKLQQVLREIAEMNRERALGRRSKKAQGESDGSTSLRPKKPVRGSATRRK